jgi:hypothetical protein
MNTSTGLQFLSRMINEHLLSALFLSATLLTILSLLCIRWWFKRRWKKLLEQKFEEENELDTLSPMGDKDLEALELIRRFRREVWELPDAELQLGVEPLTQRAVSVVRSISAVYHPDAVEPQYEASLVEILQLIQRVSSRLSRVSSAVPFKFLGNRKLSEYQLFYQVYRRIQDSPVLNLLKRNPHLYRAARWALNVKNLGNPLYWAGKELSREGYFFAVRWFYLTFSGQVGREAMRVYSGRHFKRAEDRDGALVCYRLFALAHRWGGPSADEWRALVDFVANHPEVDPDIKLQVLSRCTRNRMPADLDQQQLQTKSGAKWYREGLQRLLEQEPDSLPVKARLIEEELNILESSGP